MGISGAISQMVTPLGYGVVQAETIGRAATPARVRLGRIAPVTDAKLRSARKLQINIATFWLTEKLRLTHDR